MVQTMEQINKRPKGLWLVIIITGLMFHRAMAFKMLSEVGKTIPLPWSIPMYGDAFIGFSAIIIAFILWKFRGLGIWTIGIVWHAIGIKDYLAGLNAHAISPWDGGPGDAILIFFPFMIIVHLFCIYLLARFRDYFFE